MLVNKKALPETAGLSYFEAVVSKRPHSVCKTCERLDCHGARILVQTHRSKRHCEVLLHCLIRCHACIQELHKIVYA